jgi:hypothetical protein
MGGTATIDSTTRPPAEAQPRSTVPAESAEPLPPPVPGPLAGPSVVNAPPVAKDGSKPPDSPRGPLVSACELPSTSNRVYRGEDYEAKIYVSHAGLLVIGTREEAAEKTPDPTAAATSKYPSLLRTQAAFDAAKDRLDAVDASKDGRVVVTVCIAQLQMAAAAKRTEWSLAGEDAKFLAREGANKGNDTLQEACRLGLQRADLDVQRLKDPVFVEARENPAYARGLAAFAQFAEARARGGDVPAAAVDLLAAWKSAVSDAETRNGAYKEECQRQLAIAEREVKAVMVRRFIDAPASVEPNARSKP